MRKLTVASVSYPGCRPYRLLQDLPFVSFEENDPVENRRRLHENEVDIALIPASEFAIHGGYVGLDFGFGCQRHSSLVLCANEPIENLDTIYLYEGSCCSAYLLKVLLREKWRVSPRLVRVPHEIMANELRAHEGVLVRAEATHEIVQSYPVRYDLVTEWHSLTKSPFVFLIWAMRPGVLSLKQHQQFNEVCHRAAAVRGLLSAPLPAGLSEREQVFAKFVRERHFYYLDEAEIAGYREFCHRANRQNLLPLTEYRKATFTLLDRKPIDEVKLRGAGELLQDVVDGRRLSVREGIRLARRASLADLGLAADILRHRSAADRRVAGIFAPSAAELERYAANSAPFEEAFPALRAVESALIRLPRLVGAEASLGAIEQLLVRIRSESALPLEALSVGEIRHLSFTEGLPLERIITRLVTAGLSSIRADGGGMLIDRLLKRHHPTANFNAADWINTVKWVHRYGARSACTLTLSAVETWEDRLIHLHKLRSLQDENPGFAYFSYDFETGKRRALDPETRLRAILTARLFLDNVPTVHADAREVGGIGGLLGLSLGATDIELEVRSRSVGEAAARRAEIDRLKAVGLSFSSSTPPSPEPPVSVH